MAAADDGCISSHGQNQTKVGEGPFVIKPKQVLWFQVAMDITKTMQLLDRREDILPRGNVHKALRTISNDLLLERFRGKRHCKPRNYGIQVGIQDRHDIGMMNFGLDSNFPFEPLL